MSTVTVVATVEASNNPPRVRLDVTDVGSSPALFAATVTRLNPDGNTVTVRTTDGNPLVLTTSGANRVGLLYDYEMPYGSPVTYSTIETPANTTTVTVDSSVVWLVHPGVPDLSMVVTVSAVGDRSRRVQRGVFYPMGRSTPVVQTAGARSSAEYVLSVLTQTDVERAALDGLIADAGTLLMNVPADKDWGVTAEYVAVGDVTESRVVRFPGEALRVWELPCTVVDRPAGGSQSQRTYVDLLTFSSYTELLGAYSTYSAVLAGP